MSNATTSLPEFFAGVREGRLTAMRCAHCGQLAMPPREFCADCGRRGWETAALSGEGTIDSYTIIRVAPRNFTTEAPYAIAHVQMAEGIGLLGRVVDIPIDRLAVGTRVRFRPLGSGDRTAIGFGPA